MVFAAQIVNDTTPNTLQDIELVFANVLQAAIPLGGIVLFVFLIWAGYQFASSQGDPKRAQAAQATVTYAIVGFLFLASAFLIILIVSRLLGTGQIERFQIYIPPNS